MAALRCVHARRVLKLSRFNGIHPSDLLHAQTVLFVRVFEKRKTLKLTKFTKQDKKRRFCSSYSYLQSSVLFAPPGRHASRHRLCLLNQRSPYSRWSSSVPMCTLFSRLPQASPLRSDSFFSGAVCFVRRTLARSAFHGF